jgi:threonine synthase
MVKFHYKCTDCGKEYKRDEVRYLCPLCEKSYKPGIPLKGVLETVFDYEEIHKNFKKEAPDWTLFSAVEKEYYPPFAVGNTPFIKVDRLGQQLGFSNLWVKNDGLNPSGSLKDRASFLLVAEANRLHENIVVTASTGNAASALAAVCASAGKQAVIFVPAAAPKAKLVQIILSGAKIIPIKGTYDDAFDFSLEYTKVRQGLNRNTAYHPLTIEGKKTVGLEIFAQNGFKIPDVIVVPVGDGVIISGVWKAFHDLKMARLIQEMPRIICIQAEKSNAIHNYIVSGQYKNAENPDTIADSISVSVPSNAHMARRAVLATNGFSLTVSDEELLDGQALLARTTGIFAEPTAAAVVAGLSKIAEKKLVAKDKQIALLVTGHGLKDIDAPLTRIKMPAAIEPKLEALDKL